MSKKSSERSHSVWKVLLWIVVILAVIAVAAKIFIVNPLKQRAVNSLAEKLIQSEIASDTQLTEDIDAEELINSMSEEDKEMLEDLIDNNISAETISDVSAYLADGDTEGLKEYAKETLSEEELQEVKDLYSKYKDQLSQE